MKPTARREAVPYRWHGCWELEKRNAIARCRWFVAYVKLSRAEFYGIASGYSGGGAFEYEEFYLRLENRKAAVCIMDGVNRVTGKRAKMSAQWKGHHTRLTDSTNFAAVFDEFNYGWDNDVQYLAPSAIKRHGLIAEDAQSELPGELNLVGGTTSAAWLKSLLRDCFWITAAPSALQPRMSPVERATKHATARDWIPKLTKKATLLQRKWRLDSAHVQSTCIDEIIEDRACPR